MIRKFWYHGTKSKDTADTILKEGFAEGTYFADHLEDALEFGGCYVFEVEFSDPDNASFNWQRRCEEAIPPSRIVDLKYYPDVEVLYHNEPLRVEVFEHNMGDYRAKLARAKERG